MHGHRSLKGHEWVNRHVIPGFDNDESASITISITVGPIGYCSKAARRFLFGQSETVQPYQIKEKIESLVVNRDMILVVYGGYNDLWLLNELEIKLEPVAVVDLQKVARDVLQLPYHKSSKNDANFTLRALLMIAVRDSHSKSLDDSQQAILSAAQAIAQSTGPDNWHEKRDHIVEEAKCYIAERE
ncbi:hypothetical protein F5884DRAFT_885044 [Xylogone sp. PMI_703]|nr:hypothetical protein F5884DRAFT_885044 [Xylogone sp. PMI_703]